MINGISKLTSAISKAEARDNIRFNSSLPITISVLEKLPRDRYKLLLGNREFTTKSLKRLDKGAKYWGNFGESKDGIITISGLLKKPTCLQDDGIFIDIDVIDFLKEYKEFQFPSRNYKNWLLNNLALKDIDRALFKTFSFMLLAQNESIIHLPFKSYEKPILVQFDSSFDQEINFYLAYENLGPIKGILQKENDTISLSIKVLFEKSFYFLKRELALVDIVSHIGIDKRIEPLFDVDKTMLDIKG